VTRLGTRKEYRVQTVSLHSAGVVRNRNWRSGEDGARLGSHGCYGIIKICN
jgi:hypothetical protein